METMEHEIEATTLVGDVRDAILRELSVAHDKPWGERPEAEQKAVVERIHNAARGLVRETVMLISDRGFPSLEGVLESVAVKGGFKAVITIGKGAEGWEDLIKSQGKEVVLVIADPTAFFGTRGAVPIRPDQPTLPYAEEAAAVAAAAEQEPVWWMADDPGITFTSIESLMEQHGIAHAAPFEVGRTGWLAPRWAVALPLEPQVDDVRFFDTEAEALAFCAGTVEPAKPAQAPKRKRKPAAEQKPDEGIVMDDQTITVALTDAAPFAVQFVTDGPAIWYCWKDANGEVRCHEDSATAEQIARRQADAADDAKWATAEDRQAAKFGGSAAP